MGRTSGNGGNAGRRVGRGAEKTGAGGKGSKGPRQGPSRLAKAQLLDRIKRDTAEVKTGSMLLTLRRQGYDELPLEDVQDRMSKVRGALAEFLLARRG